MYYKEKIIITLNTDYKLEDNDSRRKGEKRKKYPYTKNKYKQTTKEKNTKNSATKKIIVIGE